MRALLPAFLALELILVAASQATDTHSWQVRLTDGNDAALSVTNNSGVLEFRNGTTLAFTIPTASITEVFHSSVRIRLSTKAHDYFAKMCCGGTQNELLPALASAIAAPFGSSKEHYVEIHWYFNGDAAVVLELGKNDYVPFMEWLQQTSGTKWVDVEQEREQAIREIEQRAGAAFRVQLSYPVASESSYFVHSYFVLPIEWHNQTALYFFQDKVKPTNVAGILPATREWADNRCVAETDVLYGRCDENGCDIKAILLPTGTYHVLPRLPEREIDTAAAAESDCSKVKQQQAEWRRRDKSDSRVTLHQVPD